MANYTTPGVYVEEISTIPPSVAPVATAIPAFIGYTEKAVEKESLHLKPFRISSMLDYESYFGYAYPQKGIEVIVDGSTITKIEGLNDTPTFKMYYALQMYFANGGGPCYIVSIGQYGIPNPPLPTPVLPPNITLTDHEKGLAAIEKEDEPTLLLFPDSNGLSSLNDYYSVMNQGLIQSNKLQDRFTIIDTYKDGAIGTSDNPIPELRNKITNETDYRKYGAAYYPYLKTIIDYNYNDAEVHVELLNQDYTSQFPVLIDQNITNGANVSLTANLNTLLTTYSALKAISPGTTPLTPTQRQACVNDLELLKMSLQDYITAFEELKGIGSNVQGLLVSPDSSLTAAINALNTWITVNLVNKIPNLQTAINKFSDTTTTPIPIEDVGDAVTELQGLMVSIFVFDVSDDTFDFIDTVIDPCLDTGGKVDDLMIAITTVQTNGINTLLEDVKGENNLLYNQIKQAIADMPMLLPPSSAIAGVYARVDNSLGVWRAPANVSLTYVIAPSQIVSNEDQGGMNVDDISGKSVNAIRAFIGKGTMVWGARTLDGNSNEWRFINVRRFYNLVEESARKATEPFVFQSNDANTWVMIRGMIESFLTQQWKAGALAGASTEQAFYVKIGLGSTMTTQDILEGRMIVEIGMAVVRPAEFIILKFTHKMQEL